jgi:hypothetical protein
MKKIDLGQAIALFANIAVIAGIVFLAFELRQNTIATQLIAAGSSAGYIRDMNALIVENGELAEMLVKRSADGELTAAERLRLVTFLSSTLIGWHAIYEQHQEGLLSDEQWRVYREGMRQVLLGYPYVQQFWARQRDSYSVGFNRLIEQLAHEPTEQ